MSARCVAGEEKEFLEKGYVGVDTEIGKVFYDPERFQLGREPEVRMIDFWGVPGIRAKDIESI